MYDAQSLGLECASSIAMNGYLGDSTADIFTPFTMNATCFGRTREHRKITIGAIPVGHVRQLFLGGPGVQGFDRLQPAALGARTTRVA